MEIFPILKEIEIFKINSTKIKIFENFDQNPDFSENRDFSKILTKIEIFEFFGWYQDFRKF